MILLSTTRQGPNKPSNSTLLAGASGLWSFNNLRNLISGEPVVISGATPPVSTRGVSQRLAGGTAPAAGTDTVQLASDSQNLLTTSGGMTVALHYRKTDASNRNSGAFGLNIASDVTRRCGAHLPYSDGIVYWDYGAGVDGTSRVTASGLTFGDDFWVFTTGPRGMEIWQNGIRRGSNAANPARTATSNAYLLGNHANTGCDSAECALFITVRRQWSPAECISWCKNPYQVLEPQRIYVKAPAAPAGLAANPARGGGAAINPIWGMAA